LFFKSVAYKTFGSFSTAEDVENYNSYGVGKNNGVPLGIEKEGKGHAVVFFYRYVAFHNI